MVKRAIKELIGDDSYWDPDSDLSAAGVASVGLPLFVSLLSRYNDHLEIRMSEIASIHALGGLFAANEERLKVSDRAAGIGEDVLSSTPVASPCSQRLCGDSEAPPIGGRPRFRTRSIGAKTQGAVMHADDSAALDCMGRTQSIGKLQVRRGACPRWRSLSVVLSCQSFYRDNNNTGFIPAPVE